MRIDYHEPKQSYVGGQMRQKQTKESGGLKLALILVCLVISFGTGFGTGWYFSQKAAKKSFQLAMQQKSLENSPQPTVQPKQVQQTPPAQPPAGQQDASPSKGTASQPQQTAGSQPPPLGFYDNLAKGEKSNVMGSGVNSREEKKGPLNAPVPSNLKNAQPQQPAQPPAQPEHPASAKAEGMFLVQAASFSSRAEADAMKAKLASKGYNVYITESTSGDRTVFRVRIGKKLEQQTAREIADRLGKGAMILPDKD